MALPNYSTGTVSVSDGGTVVTGSGTIWSGLNAVAGDMIAIDGEAAVLITDVTDVTHLSIPTWTGDKSGVDYVIYQVSSLRFDDVQIALDLQKQVQALNTEGFYVFVPSAATDPDPSLGDDGQYAFQAASGKLWFKEGGVWTFIGIQKSFGTPAPWDSGKAYVAFDVASLDGTSYVCILANTNQTPPNVTYWTVLAGIGETGPVGPASLKPVEAWVTATAYGIGPPADFVSHLGSSYECLVAHTSGTFTTDLAAGKWGLVAAKGTDGTGTGDVVGPGSATDASVVGFDSTTGKLVKELTAAEVRTAAGATTVGAAVLVATDQLSAQDIIGVQADNLVVNPEFQIDQFNAGAGVAISDNGYFGDVYRYIGEATATCYCLLSALGDRKNGEVLFGGTTDKGGIFQVIESNKSIRLRGKTATLSAVLAVNNTRLGNIKMGIVQWKGTADATTGDPISSWGADGTTPTLNSNWSFVNTPANLSVTTTATKYSVTGVVGGSTNNLALIIWNDDKSYTASDNFIFTDVDLHVGQDRPYRPVDVADDMRRVLRYSERTTAANATSYNTTLSLGVGSWSPKRSNPTLALITAGTLASNGGSVAVSNISDPTSITPTGGSWSFNVSSGLTGGESRAWRGGVIAVTARL